MKLRNIRNKSGTKFLFVNDGWRVSKGYKPVYIVVGWKAYATIVSLDLGTVIEFGETEEILNEEVILITMNNEM